MLDLYKKVRENPKIKKAFIGSGIRYDMILDKTGREEVDKNNREYLREVIKNHVSGRLKVAPEHSSDDVLKFMRKPSFKLFEELNTEFEKINKEEKLNQQLIPYFISSHPGSKSEDMANLAIQTKNMNFRLEQVQDFLAGSGFPNFGSPVETGCRQIRPVRAEVYTDYFVCMTT